MNQHKYTPINNNHTFFCFLFLFYAAAKIKLMAANIITTCRSDRKIKGN